MKKCKILLLFSIAIALILLYGRISAVAVTATSTMEISSDFVFTTDIYETTIIVTADNIVIDGNGHTLQGSGSGSGFFLNGRSGVTIKNLIIKGWNVGIFLYDSSDNVIDGNTFIDNWKGVDIEGHSSSNIINGNIFVDNAFVGIFLSTASNNLLSGNTITNNYHGVLLQVNSNKNTIIENIFKNNFYGFYLYASSNNNIICGNTLIKNENGIRLYDSSGNLIYHNNIIDNTEQAYDDNPSENYWHHPDLLEGNYWSDYPGFDDGSGSDKHAIAGDGIGDTHIPWPSQDYDYYPLMAPWMPFPRIITAIVEIDPDTLNLKSNGKWITVYIELPEGYDVSNIEVSSIMLNDTVSAEPKPTAIGDYDKDSIPDLMIKFDRDEVISYILANVNNIKGKMNVTLTITGKFNDGTPFQGSDNIILLASRNEKNS